MVERAMNDMDQATDIDPTWSGGIFGSSHFPWKVWDSENFGEFTAREQAICARKIKSFCKTIPLDIRSLLEIGIGQGGFMAYCRKQGWQTTGTKASEPSVKTAVQAGFIIKSASEAGNLPDATFDFIAGFDILEHIPQSRLLPFLRLSLQKLKRGGWFFLRFPNADFCLRRQNFPGYPAHAKAMELFRLEFFCRRAGLEVISFRPEARLGFDGGLAKRLHALVAAPIIAFRGWIAKAICLPRSRMVLTSTNAVACLRPYRNEGYDIG